MLCAGESWVNGVQRRRCARSSACELCSPAVGASEFLIQIMNSEDAQFAAPPRYDSH